MLPDIALFDYEWFIPLFTEKPAVLSVYISSQNNSLGATDGLTSTFLPSLKFV